MVHRVPCEYWSISQVRKALYFKSLCDTPVDRTFFAFSDSLGSVVIISGCYTFRNMPQISTTLVFYDPRGGRLLNLNFV